MPPRLLRKLIVGCVLVAATALAEAAERLPFPAGSSGAPVVSAPPRFRISGHVTGLFPGARTKMRLTIRNPNRYPIRVSRIRTKVRSGSRLCPARTVKVAPFVGARRIAPGSAIRVRVRVRMRVGAPDACAGRRYRLLYRGWAKRV